MKKYVRVVCTILIHFFFLAFVSCGNDELGESHSLSSIRKFINLTTQEYASIAFDNPKELTEIEAINIAESFIQAKKFVEAEKVETKSSSEHVSFKVSSKYYYGKISSSGILTKSSFPKVNAVNVPIYELTIIAGVDTGLVIVSGDERAQKVIAYIPKTNEEARKKIPGAKYLEELAKINLLDNIVAIKKLQDSLRIHTIEKIANKLDLDKNDVKFDEIKDYLSINDEPLSKFQPIQTPPSQVLSCVMPICLTSWDQTTPYNCQMPIGNIAGYSNPTNYYTGCGVIALAQIMTFLEPSLIVNNITMDWGSLKQSPNIGNSDPLEKRNMVGYLIRDIYNKTGSFPAYNSSGYIIGVGTYFTETENYIRLYANCSSLQNWNSDMVRNSLLAYRPVMTMGADSNGNASHIFIVDGYLLCKLYYGAVSASVNTETKELVKLYDLYFHANLGWGGISNGYYLINKDTSVNFETASSTYGSGNLIILPNIAKK
jgi:hypothetical protein